MSNYKQEYIRFRALCTLVTRKKDFVNVVDCCNLIGPMNFYECYVPSLWKRNCG